MSAGKRIGSEGQLKSIRVINGNRSGFTLIELLISVAILGIIMVGLSQVLGTALSSYENTKGKQDLIREARYAMERMVMFIQETDGLVLPDTTAFQENLKVNERLLNMYDNQSGGFLVDGDSWLDADNNFNQIVNEGEPDRIEYITFSLDKSDSANWKLTETRPDYSTSNMDDYLSPEVICEWVKVFQCRLFAQNVIEIELILSDGRGEVSLRTRAKARLLD
ncbi:MAG: prepilin-type N-terminal cleavage/methylation domain-containing protein [Deltaproteobacteria bacterium]|nr:prepilin-type N-terminal cleavage/methylation domain-containing protein [Deltaproteobacteria bacterium]